MMNPGVDTVVEVGLSLGGVFSIAKFVTDVVVVVVEVSGGMVVLVVDVAKCGGVLSMMNS